MKDLKSVPDNIRQKFHAWVKFIEQLVPREVMKYKGFHDEPLKGKRKGQRSIRLSKAYRAIYRKKKDGTLELVQVLEVNKHDY